MVQFYIMMIQRGAITIDDVPIKWREEVSIYFKNNGGGTT